MSEFFIALWHVGLHEALLLLAGAIAILSLDDLLVDLMFGWLLLRGRLRHPPPASTGRPGPMAIIIPAWDESAVIGAMLRRLTATLDYPDYHIFVGTYPNDPATQAAVGAVGDARITTVVGPRPGPTTKADCLNHLWRAVLAHEARGAMRFKAVVLHDAEDLVHPQALRLMDAAIPAAQMVQLPVMPLPDPASPFIAGHYMDEFAEAHTRELPVRQALGATVPSAGVGCAIARDMLGRIAAASAGQPFDPACLTEDYELGHKISRAGGITRLLRVRHEGGLIATAEFFPASFAGAVRQKARWLTGIALAGWDRLGWHGGLAERWMLLRDRKAPLSALLTLAAYGLLALLMLDDALRRADPLAAALPPVTSGAVLTLLWLNFSLLCWRLLVRALFTTHAYGPVEGLMALPRALVGNVINAAAAWVALGRYLGALRGTPLAWDKTSHRFPGVS